MTDQQQRAGETSDQFLEQLESEKAGLEAQVADPAFYSRERDEVRQKLERLGALPSQIEQMYARWTQLDAATKVM